MTTKDPKEFRLSLGQFPTGVTIVTTRAADGEPVGVTVSSFNSVSMDPPLILYSIDRRALSAPIFAASAHFAVNVLGESQVALASRFARRGDDKFGGVDFHRTQHGCPVFAGSAARFECRTWAVYDGGDHLIVVGEVLHYEHDLSIRPLLFSRGSYAVPTPHPSSVMQPDEIALPENGFLNNYLFNLLHMALTCYTARFNARLADLFQVTPEEFWVLAILKEAESTSAAELAALVMQPDNVFNAMAKWMQKQGRVQVEEARLRLTPQGSACIDAMIETMNRHEAEVLGSLQPCQAEPLKAGLKQVIQALR